MQPFLNTVAAHHADAANPDLLVWIKDLIDQMFGVGPWTIVFVIAVFILAMPLALIIFYVGQKRRIEQVSPGGAATKR